MKPMSLFLVAVQLMAIGLFLLTGPWIASIHWIWLQIAGLYLTVWAVLTIRPQHVRLQPDVARGARLVTAGPYRLVRHPMYLGILLFSAGLLLNHPSWMRTVVWLVLLADLLAKIRYEEDLLAKRFPQYAAYQKRTKQLFPYVY